MSNLYRKKPVTIEAREIRTYMDLLGPDGIAEWCGGLVGRTDTGPAFMYLHTLEGTMRADIGDWIIKGVDGEFYPCKHKIFVQTYEAVTE